jgi:hypothetical protein
MADNDALAEFAVFWRERMMSPIANGRRDHGVRVTTWARMCGYDAGRRAGMNARKVRRDICGVDTIASN